MLVVSWLTISPLFLIYDGWWKLLPKWLRIVLFVFSPMVLIILLLANHAAVEHFHRYHFSKPRVIEKVTGVQFPSYKVVDYSVFGHGLLPTCYKTVLEFEDVPNDAFYEALGNNGDSYIEENDSVRTFSFGEPYKYFIIDFQGLFKHGDAYIKVKEGSKAFLILLFEWPDNNQFFQKDSELVDWETILKEYEADLATIKTSPCIYVDTDSLSVYYPNFSRVDLVTGVMPDRMDDSAVVFCCEAAFTGECLKEFKHTNIAGDHVSSGVRYRGYPERNRQCLKRSKSIQLPNLTG